MLEDNFRRAMLLSRGSFAVFVTRPISGALLGAILLLVIGHLSLAAYSRRSRARAGDGPRIGDRPSVTSNGAEKSS